jgi:polysaccharide biosynthesis transport protein
MQPNHESSLSYADLFHAVRTHVRWWVVSAVVGVVVAAAYSLVSSREWRATQALMLRPEAASVSEQKLGKFSDLSEMKLLQATILELAKSHSVMEATLRSVGPKGWFPSAQFPTAQDLETFRQQIDMRPPGGAEFGQTEVFYLSVRDTNRERAAKLVAVLADELEKRMQNLRDDRAQSQVAELNKTVAMAEADLSARTDKLSQFEASIGADLVELRSMTANVSGQGEVSQELQAIEADRRGNVARQHDDAQLLILLKAAQEDPRQLIAMPSSLLSSQPALSQLKDALVQAQVHTASLLGTYADDHPYVLAAKETETRLQAQLHDELSLAIKGIEVDSQLAADRAASLDHNTQAGRERLARLASARAEYANLVSAVDNHTKLVETARKNLADARADHASAHSASVLGRIDGVESGVAPIGPGRVTITAAGGVAGLTFGFGLVFLFAVPQTASATNVVSPVETVSSSVQNAKAACHGTTTKPVSAGTQQAFGFSRGMTLEEAVRSVEARLGSRAK